MTNKIWDSSSWKEYKNLRVYNGSAWKDAAKGWLYNGTAWKQFYPEYPVNTSAPTISGSSTQGNILSVTNGSWRGFPNDKAFSYTSTAYQWLRNGSDISGATGNQYATVVADVGSAISCRVTASNGRGPTPSTTSNSITIQSALPSAPTNLSVVSSTLTPGVFSVSSSSPAVNPIITMGGNTNITSSTGQINWSSSNQSSWQISGSFSGSGTSQTSYYASSLASSTIYSGNVTIFGPGSTTANGSWTLPTNFSYYTYNTNTGSLSADPTARTFTLTANTGAFYVVDVTAWNINGRATISWSAGNNATSYDIYINGSLWQQGYVGTSIVYNWGTTGNLTVNVRSRNSQGAESTGVTAIGTVNQAGLISQTSGYINSGNSAFAPYSFATLAPEPSVYNVQESVGTVPNTTRVVSWDSVNQASYIVNVYTSGGSFVSQLSSTSSSGARSRQFSSLTAGASYYATVIIYNQVNYGGSSASASTVVWTQPGGAVATPSAPGTPTLSYVSANNTSTTWGYSATWGASTGSGTIQYQIDALGSAGGTGTISSLSGTGPHTFNLSRNDNTWQIRVRATNNGGSTWSAYSAYSNSA